MKLRENTSIVVVVTLELVTADKKSQFVAEKICRPTDNIHLTDFKLLHWYSTRGSSKNTDTADPTKQHIYSCLSCPLDETTPPNNPLLSFTPTPPLSGSYLPPLSSLSPPVSFLSLLLFFLLLFFLFLSFLSSLFFFSFLLFSLPFFFFLLLFFPFFSFLFLFFSFLFFSFPFPLFFPLPLFSFFPRRQRNFTDNILTSWGVSHTPLWRRPWLLVSGSHR